MEERKAAEMAGREKDSREETMWIMSAIPSSSNNLEDLIINSLLLDTTESFYCSKIEMITGEERFL